MDLKNYEEFMKITDEISFRELSHPYSICSKEEKKIVNGLVQNYLYFLRIHDEGITIEDDPSIWDESYGTEEHH